MKRLILAFAIALIAVPATAGLTYDFRSVTTGRSGFTLAGTASVEGKNVRIDFESGDNLIFKDNSILISTDGGASFVVLDPATKRYYEFSLQELLTNAVNVLKAVGGMVEMSVTNQDVKVRQAGEGEPIEGYPTLKYVVTSSYDLSLKIMGMATNSKVNSVTEIWYTTEIPSDYMTFIQHKGLKTGLDDLDNLIEAHTATVQGFPLRQVTTSKATSGKQTETTVTTTTISGIKAGSIPVEKFELPAGYERKETPALGIPNVPQ